MDSSTTNRSSIEASVATRGRPVSAQVRGLYRLVARVYDRISPLWVRSYRHAYQRWDQALIRYLPRDGRVLDLGCGTGANLEILRRLRLPYSSYVGVDQSAAMLSQAREKFGHHPSASFLQLNLLEEPLPTGPFELIVSTWVLEHLPRPGLILMRANEALNLEGHMLLMFEIDGRRLRDRLLSPIWSVFGARLMPEAEARGFPGLVSLDRFDGTGPTLALAILSKR